MFSLSDILPIYKVWKFSVEKYSSYHSTKKVWTDGRTDRPQMSDIRSWPRSCPEKHSDEVWKFSVEKYSSYRSTKKVWTDRRTDGQTDPRWPILELDQDLTQTNILTKFESSLQKSIPVIAAQCSIRERNVKNPKKLPVTLTFDIMTPKTIGVLLIWYITHIQSLKVLGWKVFELSQHKESVDGQTDRQMWQHYLADSKYLFYMLLNSVRD